VQLCPSSPHPLRVLKLVHGYTRVERYLHWLFLPYWVHGEWFQLEPIREAIEVLDELLLVGEENHSEPLAMKPLEVLLAEHRVLCG
jgi:hypothetical protein